MKNKVHLVYFSATGTTKTILGSISRGIGIKAATKYDITQGQSGEVDFSEEDLVIFGVPVYAGRIPASAIDSLNKFKGSKTPAIGVVVYGNREFDDALLELKTIIKSNNFNLISLGAFVAEHSIFPVVAQGRPDEMDKNKAEQFGKESIVFYTNRDESIPLPEIPVKGNFPYKEAKPIPLKPKGNHHCNKCGACVKACPAQAIRPEHPRRTDKSRCISCARCISVCPQNARHFGGILYKIVRRKFVKAYSGTRKEPEVFFARSGTNYN